jgi:hypothetical protein
MFNFLKNGNEEFLRLEVFKLAKLVHEHDKEVIFDTNEFKLFRVFFIDNFLNRSYEDNLKEVIEEFSAKKKNKNMLSDLYHSLASYEEALKSIPFEMAKKYAIRNGANHSNYENNPEDDVLLFWINSNNLCLHFAFNQDDNGNPFGEPIEVGEKGNFSFSESYNYGISLMKGSNYGQKGTIIQCESKMRMTIRMNLSL